MRGTSRARPCLSAARAFLAGAAILAGAAATALSARADDTRPPEPPEDTALAVPRLHQGDGGVALPRPLSAAIARRLRATFADPQAPLDGLEDTSIIGTLLAGRYLSATTHPELDTLRAWLDRFALLPDAPAIHALLVGRLPRGATPPAAPVLPAFVAAPSGDDVEASIHVLPRNPVLDRAVHDAARAGHFDRARHMLARTRGLSPRYGALLRAEVARAMFSQGRDDDALNLAETAAREGGGSIGAAAWIAGLAAWRLDRPELAARWFVAAYHAPLTTPGRRAAAAYWAARAIQSTGGDPASWIHRAARNPRTFYGLLARHVLGQSIPRPDTPRDTLGEADVDAVAATARGIRAFALLQVGQPARAAAELRLLWSETRDQPGFGRSVLVVARTAGLQDLAAQLDAVMQPASVRLPPTRLRPANGFRFDPALVYALTRLESNFDAAAVSPSGARGLMQIMPDTAEFVLAGAGRRLHDPATNLDLGQRYLLALTQREAVGQDLIRLLAAYNAGPGALARWLDTMPHEDDPLLFIEMIPGAETRAYVPRALAYSWLYAAQLRLPSPSLDDLAAAAWPAVPFRAGPRLESVALH